MAGDWTTIGDIAEVFDGPHATPKKIEEGPYFLSISSLEQGKLDLSKSAHISEEQYIKWTKRVTPQEGDVLFSYETRLGEAALMPGGIKACLGRRMGLLRPNKEVVDPSYLLFAYLSPDFQREIVARTNSGATVDRIALKELPSFPIRIPKLQEQREIASVLSALDNKIELNRQINATLESMAQALFKSWFVDFDPVIDNALAAGNPIPEPLQARAEKRAALLAASAADTRSPNATDNTHPTQTAPHTQSGTTAPATPLQPLPADLRALFPDSFVFNEEMGWVPEGWEVKQVGELLELAYGKALAAKNRIPGEVPVYGSGGVSGFHNEAIVDAPGIIVGRKGTVGSLYWVEKDFFPIDTVFYVKNKSKMPLYWLYRMLATLRIENMGADSAVPGVNRNVVCACKVIVPSDVIADFFGKLSESFNSRRSCLSDQNQYLSDVRDLLLPKLLSGKIQLPEAKRAYVEAAQ
ncbi:putative type I restriction modification system [Alcanivorax sp. NBRC 101098]|uniref:restriction endonuclease subunit S n=1 Tax=Alcanivorax sp. NBRC 101098 TaxID=1113728 RepID=UPI0004ABE842|nr:restriction endonuclease subunit S [Alcanivorax sp. NBRC 101098]BAP14741.1 putative type I restriction modification system [Alcanivorax sp. NBRC 101098]